MNKKKQEFFTLEEVRLAIDKFENQTFLKIKDFDNIEDYLKYYNKIFHSYFYGISNPVLILNPNIFKFNLFRVRELDSIKNKNLFCEHSYPPLKFTPDGRCNFRNNPVFYCSNNPLTALNEVIRDSDFKSKKYCISVWSLIQNESNFYLDIYLQNELHSLNPFKILAENTEQKINDIFNNLTESQKLGVIEFHKFIAKKFIADEDYSISAFLSHKRLNTNEEHSCDMIIYPSVQTDLISANFAIHPNFVDNCMKVEMFYIVEVNSINKKTTEHKLTFSKYGKIEKNIIIWKDLMLGDSYYEENFLKHFNKNLKSFEYNKDA